MSLKEQLTADMKDAMKAKEAGKQRLSVIRLVRGAIRQLEIDGKKELVDEDVLGVISKEAKQRRDAIEEFKNMNIVVNPPTTLYMPKSTIPRAAIITLLVYNPTSIEIAMRT